MQYELNLRDYIRIFQKRKWVIMLMPVAAGLLGYFLTVPPPVMYEASGKFRVSQRGAPIDMMMQTFYYWEEGSRLDTHAEVMLSRETLKEVLHNLGLIDIYDDEGNPIPDEMLFALDSNVDLITNLRNSITPSVVEGTSILQVAVTRPRREQAVKWTNALLDTYAARNNYEVNQQVIDGFNFLQERLRTVETQLAEAHDRLTSFMLANAEQLSIGGTEVATTQQQLEQAQTRLRNTNGAIEFLDDLIASGNVPRPDFLSNIAVDEQVAAGLGEVLKQLDATRTRLLAYQTPDSPEVLALEAEIRQTVESMKASLEAARELVIEERDRLSAKFMAMPSNDADLAVLRRDVDVNTQLYTEIRSRLETASLQNAQATPEVQIIERPLDAAQVSETGRGSNSLIAAAIGLLLGVIIALVVETLDTSIGAIEDVESLLDLPVIGIIPPIDFDDIKGIIRGAAPQMLDHPDLDHLAGLVAHYDPRSPVAEAYRALRTNVEKARAKADGRVFIVTSSVLEEGKTTTAANLALTFAQMGRKTLLIAADLRRPDLHRIFGLQKEPGLADVLTGSMPWESAIRSLSDVLLGELSMDVVMLTPGMDNLHVLPSGANPLNPAELLTSKATAELLQELRAAFEIVVVDTPPIIPVTDAAILAEHVDGVVLVYEVGKVGRDVLKRAKSHLDNVNASIWGIVMNDVRAEAETTLRDTDYYYYHHRYDEAPPTSGSRLRARIGKTAAKILGGRRG